MRLRLQLIAVTSLRTVLNTLYRMVYPFLSVFARGLGVDVNTLSLIVSARSFAGILSPVFASVADRQGRKFGMLGGLGFFITGVGVAAIHPNLLTLSIALIFGVFSKAMFDPAMQAYFGDRIAYEQRGTAMAITEMNWSAAYILGVPLIGWLIARGGWAAPFPVLTAAGVVMLGVVWIMIPRADPYHAPSGSTRENFRLVLTSAAALAGILLAVSTSFANELVSLIFGVWLSDSFGLQIAALAGASAVIGFAELGGESLVATLTDRIGKARAVTIGLVANILAALLLPVLGRSTTGALIGLFLFSITYEFMVVSQIPIMTELVPRARATMMALVLVGYAIGRSAGDIASTLLYQHFGFVVVTIAASAVNLLARLALAEMRRGALLPRLLGWFKQTFARAD
jgi:predicted MFS family arabinose efflux permease